MIGEQGPPAFGGPGQATFGTLGGPGPPCDPAAAVPDEILRARAYLSRVAEPPAPYLAAFARRCGAVEAARRVRAGDVPVPVATETRARCTVDRAEADLAVLASRGGRLVVPESPDWPTESFAGLGVGDDAPDDLGEPVALWVRGSVPLVEPSIRYGRAVAVVGARAATDYGLWVARDWSAGLADRGMRVVSGAALGIDGAAHRGALAAGGTTVAVLACGIDRPYPPSNAGLLEHIAATGLVVTEHPPGTVPARYRFLVRNRLVAALARGTLVVEAAVRSGARRTATVAAALSRSVMVVPGPVSSALSVGCHLLARDAGATVVGRVDDVVEDVVPVGEGFAPHMRSPRRPTDGLSLEAQRVLEALSCRAARSAVRLAHDSGVDPARITTHLRDLVAAGLVGHDESGWRRRPE